MRYLVDSDWFIDYLDGLPQGIQLLGALVGDGIGISVITYIEVYQGVQRRRSLVAEETLETTLAIVPVLPVSLAIAQRCAGLREALRRRGRRTRSRALDLIIAATALEHDLTLVTRNIADYQDIPGLTLHR